MNIPLGLEEMTPLQEMENTLENHHSVIAEEDDFTVSSRIVKEGILEKKGHSTAFFMWPK